MIAASNAKVSRRELWIFFYKFRTRLLIAFFIPLLLSALASTIPTPQFKAEAVLVVRLGSEYVYQPEVGNSPTGNNSTILFDREQIFKSEVAILGSDDLHREVIKDIGLEKMYPEIINPSKGTQIRRFLMGGFLSALKPAKQQTPEELDQYRLAVATESFGKHLDILLEKESAVINMTFEHADRAIAKETLEVLLKHYFEKRKQLYLEPRAELAETQLTAAREHVQAAQEALEAYKQKHQLFSLEDQRKQLLEKRSDAERRATSIRNAALDQEIQEYNTALSELDAQEREFKALQKEADIANEAYALNSHRLDEAKAYEVVQREKASSVKVIQPPTAPPEPKKLKYIILLVGSITSLFIVLLVAIISEFTRRGFLTPEDAERQLKLPVIVAIPYNDSLR